MITRHGVRRHGHVVIRQSVGRHNLVRVIRCHVIRRVVIRVGVPLAGARGNHERTRRNHVRLEPSVSCLPCRCPRCRARNTRPPGCRNPSPACQYARWNVPSAYVTMFVMLRNCSSAPTVMTFLAVPGDKIVSADCRRAPSSSPPPSLPAANTNSTGCEPVRERQRVAHRRVIARRRQIVVRVAIAVIPTVVGNQRARQRRRWSATDNRKYPAVLSVCSENKCRQRRLAAKIRVRHRAFRHVPTSLVGRVMLIRAVARDDARHMRAVAVRVHQINAGADHPRRPLVRLRRCRGREIRMRRVNARSRSPPPARSSRKAPDNSSVCSTVSVEMPSVTRAKSFASTRAVRRLHDLHAGQLRQRRPVRRGQHPHHRAERRAVAPDDFGAELLRSALPSPPRPPRTSPASAPCRAAAAAVHRQAEQRRLHLVIRLVRQHRLHQRTARPARPRRRPRRGTR